MPTKLGSPKTSKPSLTRLGELTVRVLCLVRGLPPRLVESCLNRVRLDPSPAATKGTWQPDFESFFSMLVLLMLGLGLGLGLGEWGGEAMTTD